jgi:D-glycero-D-manno-heptose 1,7-bisphosphate phosphatase
MRNVILDRDGVINRDSDHFIKSAGEWVALPGSLEAITRLCKAGVAVHVATNQSGLARGLFSRSDLEAMHQKLQDQLAVLGGEIASIHYCPHGPDDDCDCRKPRPGLYRQIAAASGFSLEGVPVVGDSLRDLQAAADVGAQPILVRTGKGERTLAAGGLPEGTKIYPDLDAAVDALLKASQ